MINVESQKKIVENITDDRWIDSVNKDENYKNVFSPPKWCRQNHTGHSLLGKTSFFHMGDTAQDFEQNKLNNKKLSLLKQNGWLEEAIRYHIDMNGFRTDNSVKDYHDYTDQDNVIYAGCSYSFGTGLNLEDTWTYRLHKQIHKEKNYVNLSSPGVGIESIYRYMRYWIPKLKPSHVYIQHMWTSSRSELWYPTRGDYDANLSFFTPDVSYLTKKEQLLTEKDFLNSLQKTHWFFINKYYSDKSAPNINYPESVNFSLSVLYDPQPSMLRLIKNLDALKFLFWKYKVKGYIFPKIDIQEKNLYNKTDIDDFARDLMHPGKKTHIVWNSYYKDIIKQYKEFDYYNTSEVWRD